MFQATHDYLLSKYKPHTSHGTALIGATKMTKNGEFVVIIVIVVIIINDDHSHKNTFIGAKYLSFDDHGHFDQQGNGVGRIAKSGTGQIGSQGSRPMSSNVLIKTLIMGMTIKMIIMIILMMSIVIIM